jgi:type I restriction enzyme S subunit
LAEVCNFHAGVGFPTEMQGSSGHELPFYKVKDVSVAWLAQSSFLLDTEHSLSREDAGRIKAKPVPAGTVVFAKIGEALRLNRRAIAARPSLIDNNLMGIEAPPTRLAQRFLYWFTLATKFDVDARASVVPSIRKSDVGNLSFPLPPLNEQTRIVEKLEELLSDLDAGVAELKAAQKKLAQYRQSLFKAAVEGALTAEWRQEHPPAETGEQLLQRILTERRARWEAKQLAKFKEQGKAPPKDWQKKYPEPVRPETSGLPELPQGWVWASVDELCDSVRNGLSKTPNTEQRGFPIFKINAVRPMAVNFEAIKHIEIAESEAADYWVETGDVLATRYNGSIDLLGVFAMVQDIPQRTLHPDKLIRMKPVIGAGLGAWMEVCGNVGASREHLVSRVKTTAGQTGISGDDLKKTPIPLPPANEQAAAIELLNDRLEGIKELSQPTELALKQSAAQRQNILRAAFAGQLVPQDPADEPASVLLERIRAERAAQAQVKKPQGRQKQEHQP